MTNGSLDVVSAIVVALVTVLAAGALARLLLWRDTLRPEGSDLLYGIAGLHAAAAEARATESAPSAVAAAPGG
jgi:hypothetical protein